MGPSGGGGPCDKNTMIRAPYREAHILKISPVAGACLAKSDFKVAEGKGTQVFQGQTAMFAAEIRRGSRSLLEPCSSQTATKAADASCSTKVEQAGVSITLTEHCCAARRVRPHVSYEGGRARFPYVNTQTIKCEYMNKFYTHTFNVH